MRVSSLQVFNTGVRNMQSGQASLAKLQEQISTGKNLNRPSDDPVAAAQLFKLRREHSANETYTKNIGLSERRLELEEQTLRQIKDAADRLNELAIRGSTGTMNNQNRASIATEAEQIQQFVLGLMNTKDAQGEYLFAGAKGHTQPFDVNAQGNFAYNGDSETRQIQTGPSAFVQSTDSGREIFQVVPGDVTVSLLSRTIIPATSTLPGGLELSVIPATTPGAIAEFTHQPDLALTVTAAVGATPAKYTLTDSLGNVYSADIQSSASSIDISPPGLRLDLGAAASTLNSGDVITTTIRSEQPRQSILTTAQTLIDAFKTPITDQASRDKLAADAAKVIDELGLVMKGLGQAQTKLGGRLVALDLQQEVNLDMSIILESGISSIEDLDYASAIAKFSYQEVALQAAQQTFVRVNQLSLFNYL